VRENWRSLFGDSVGEAEGSMFKRMIESIKLFFAEVRAELKKVSFPTRAETIGSTTVVIVFCILMSLYLSVIDSFLVWLVSKII
jgi:preprotein translocase subunit SecE